MAKASNKGGGQMTRKDLSKLQSEQQASSLIDLVLLGEDPIELMTHAVDEIQAEAMGPFQIGVTIKVNQAYTAEKVGGGTVALAQGDAVTIVQPHLGENGYDRMVLLSDGVTRAIVPLKVLGEQQEEDVDEEEVDEQGGSGGAEVPSKGGKPTAIAGKTLGAAAPSSPPEKKGGALTMIPSAVVGKPAPTSPPEKKGSSTPMAISGKKLESLKTDIAQALEMMVEGEEDKDLVTRVSALATKVKEAADVGTLTKFHNLLFKDDSTLENLESLFTDQEPVSEEVRDFDPLSRMLNSVNENDNYR